MNIIHAPQGSAEWLAVRAKHFTASEAPAMMGASKYQTRAELLRQKHTGLAAEVDENTQRLFDRGHEAEAAARPIVEEIIGDDLSPMTGALEVEGLPLLASFDGVTQGRDIVWENKLRNNGLADAVRAGEIGPHYYWQLEQQLLVSGAERAYFTTSDGTPENTVGMWYESVPERRTQLIAGWKQFSEDLAEYVHVETAPAPVAATIEALPALMVQVEGKVLATNLDAFKRAAQTFIDGIKTELVNDQDFADADKMVKFLKDGEERLALAKDQALAQTASIDELFRTVDAISEQMRSKRLALDKLVKAEKDNRRAEIVNEARKALGDHYAALARRVGVLLPAWNQSIFADAIKGLKSIDSMRDKVAGALANAKIEANEIADRIEANRKAIPEDKMFLFPDFASVCTKTAEDFDALFSYRYGQHLKAQEAERERIRQEEADRISRDAARAELQAKAQAANDQRGKTEEATHAEPNATARPQAPAASTPPIQSDESIIDDFIRLLSIGIVEKKALRPHLLAWEKYRIAREMSAAA